MGEFATMSGKCSGMRRQPVIVYSSFLGLRPANEVHKDKDLSAIGETRSRGCGAITPP